jgi:hypothetical protein
LDGGWPAIMHLLTCHNTNSEECSPLSMSRVRFEPNIPAVERPKSKSKLCYGRRSVGQSVWVSSPHLGPKTRFLMSGSCGFVDVGRPLTRGKVCRLQLLLVLASAVILGSESRGTRNRILQSQIRDSPNLECEVPVFISPQEESGPVIPPGSRFPLRRLLRLAGSRWRYSCPPPHGDQLLTKSQCRHFFLSTSNV